LKQAGQNRSQTASGDSASEDYVLRFVAFDFQNPWFQRLVLMSMELFILSGTTEWSTTTTNQWP
jgi:hypothetical protein